MTNFTQTVRPTMRYRKKLFQVHARIHPWGNREGKKELGEIQAKVQ